jgi:molybdopterin-guanine dinucleotide biosynthesis protein A
MAGLMSAFEKHPETSWLVVGCDYPLIDLNDLKRLMESRTENTPAISYFNFKELKEEPVLAVYERECYPLLFKNFNEGKYSLREFLRENNCEKIIPSSLEKLRSIDSSAEFEEISSYLQRKL